MVIDTSALVAIMANEPERDVFVETINTTMDVLVSAASLLETRIALAAKISSGKHASPAFIDSMAVSLDRFLEQGHATVEAVTPRLTDIAFDAFRRFGKGTGHGAKLSFGDCFSYALAKHLDVPLLFKGGDFAQTDIQAAVELPPIH